jgi:hypothetical protein
MTPYTPLVEPACAVVEGYRARKKATVIVAV